MLALLVTLTIKTVNGWCLMLGLNSGFNGLCPTTEKPWLSSLSSPPLSGNHRQFVAHDQLGLFVVGRLLGIHVMEAVTLSGVGLLWPERGELGEGLPFVCWDPHGMHDVPQKLLVVKPRTLGDEPRFFGQDLVEIVVHNCLIAKVHPVLK